MIFSDSGAIYAQCDACKIIVFAGWPTESKADIVNSMTGHGWKVGKQCKCPWCNNGQW